ncbi:hypothetical protein [Chondromyces crocatus]|uniref:hypothetical protein n=1 Tax=Chondromyces crocatus TaxID=52 RepID=UPI0012E2B8E0|nr:hypothetical protein [Chondromyces crocatus]
MAGPTDPDVGEMHIDARGVLLKAVHVENRSKILKLRGEAEEVMEAILLLTPDDIAQAGLHPDDIDDLRALILEHRRAMRFFKAAERMADKLRQTTLAHGHEIAGRISEIAAQGQRRARRSPERSGILDALMPLIRYQAAPAKRSWVTRLKNQGSLPDEAPESAMPTRAMPTREEEEPQPASQVG